MDKLSKIFIFLLVLFTTQGNSQKQSLDALEGKYINYNLKGAHDSEMITFSKNHTVTYNLKHWLIDLDLTGIWSISNDTILLNFKMPPEKIERKIEIIYGNKKQKKLNLTVRDSIYPLVGSKIFVNQEEYDHGFENISIKPTFIKMIKIIYNEETYAITINKYIDKDIDIRIIPAKHKEMSYDLITTKWLFKSYKIILLKEGKVIENYFLVKQ